jgi:hypothetical protein
LKEIRDQYSQFFYNWQEVFLESALEGLNKTKSGRRETQQKMKIMIARNNRIARNKAVTMG